MLINPPTRPMTLASICRFAILVSGLACAFSATAAPDYAADLARGPIAYLDFFKVAGALLITILTIFGFSILARKARWVRHNNGGQLRIVDSLAVGTRDRIMLVAVADQRIVVAASAGQMRALHVYDATSERGFSDTLDAASVEAGRVS